jgi:hypothetical protein
MASPRSALPVAGLAAALAVGLSACSDDATEGSPQPSSDVTTIDLTLKDQPIDLSGATLTCYDFEGHLSLEASGKDAEATHFLMDFYNNGVSLSIHIKGSQPDLYDYDPTKSGQNAVAKRDGNIVTVTGMIGVSLDDTTPPSKFSITADCGKFVNTPPGSSGVG